MLVSAAPVTLPAQHLDQLGPGARVRIEMRDMPGRRLTGTIVHSAPDTVRLALDGFGGAEYGFARYEIVAAELDVGGTKGAQVARYAASGAARATIAMLAGAMDTNCLGLSDSRDPRCWPTADGFVAAPVLGAPVGALAGGAVGLVRPAARWVPLVLARRPALRVYSRPPAHRTDDADGSPR
ncbi:MAG: hypothetical protein MUF21_13950 [Gemmatimonadaceae bacterium]|nr:hypothetical protein [Gemmatimonadaceae bacterium]